MPVLRLKNLRELQDRIGEEIVVTEWMEITQERIDRFADCTEDHQWIHVNPERARQESPFRGTIAHGFLTVSMLSRLLNSSLQFETAKMGVNYGFNRLRFTGPVPAGSRLRGRFTLQAFDEIQEGVQTTWHVVVECEGSKKPCLVADWITRRYE